MLLLALLQDCARLALAAVGLLGMYSISECPGHRVCEATRCRAYLPLCRQHPAWDLSAHGHLG